MQKFPQILSAGILAVLLGACGGPQAAAEYADDLPPPAPASATAAAFPAADNKALSAASSFPYEYEPDDASAPAANRKVINRDLVFETENVRQTVTALEDLTKRHNGFVEAGDIYTISGKAQEYRQIGGNMLQVRRYTHQADMRIRIPQDNLAAFVRDMQRYIVFLDKSQFRAEDLILDIRRRALAADRKQQISMSLDEADTYRPPVSPAPAETAAPTAAETATATAVAASDASAPATAAPATATAAPTARNTLFDERAKADYARIQRKYWQDKIDFATITMHFRQPESVLKKTVPNLDAVAEQHKLGFEAMLAPMLKQGWSGFLGVVLFFIGIWPLALGVPLLWMAWKRWRQSADEETEEERPEEPIPYPFDDDEDDDERF